MAGTGGAKTRGHGLDHRQPIRQHDGKRGARGYDAGKKIKGRKRHIVVDTLGLLIAVYVHPADVQDRDGGLPVMAAAAKKTPTLEKTWADAAYRGRFVQKVKDDLHIEVEVVTRADANSGAWQEEGTPPLTVNKGFKVLPWRWLVERTLAWVSRNRRLSKDYEGLLETAEAFIWVVAMRLLAARLAADGAATAESPYM